jgi:prepilin-type N-terminal cleavage/methylation domain-containing protein
MKHISAPQRNIPGRQGFTLLETLLSLMIAATLITVICFFLNNLFEARVRQQVMATVEQEGERAMDILTQAIRNSQAINEPTLGATSSSLSVATYDPAKNPTAFALNGGVLEITAGAAAPLALTSNLVNVSDLIFSNLSSTATTTPGVWQISYAVSYAGGERAEYNYSRTFVGSAGRR